MKNKFVCQTMPRTDTLLVIEQFCFTIEAEIVELCINEKESVWLSKKQVRRLIRNLEAKLNG